MPATPTPREMQCRISATQSPFGGRFPVQRRPLPTLCCTYRRPSAENRAMPLDATRPSPPPPPPQETPCRVSVAQSPNEGRCSVHKAVVATFQLPPFAWIAVLAERRRPVRDYTFLRNWPSCRSLPRSPPFSACRRRVWMPLSAPLAALEAKDGPGCRGLERRPGCAVRKPRVLGQRGEMSKRPWCFQVICNA